MIAELTTCVALTGQPSMDEPNNTIAEVSCDEKLCTGCHNSDSPSFKEFNYADAWAKIKHSKP